MRISFKLTQSLAVCTYLVCMATSLAGRAAAALCLLMWQLSRACPKQPEHNPAVVVGARMEQLAACDAHLQEGLEGGSWELQACQPDLSARQDYGAIHPECAHWACEGQPRVQAQPAWVHERQVLRDQP